MKPILLFSHWEQVRADLYATIDKFREDELGYIPFTGSWSVGQIMLHIAECEDHWLHALVRHEFEPPVDYQLSEYPDKATIKQVLSAAHNRTLRFLQELEEQDLDREYLTRHGETFKLSWIIWHVLEHEIHHRGELSLMLGQLGREGLDV